MTAKNEQPVGSTWDIASRKAVVQIERPDGVFIDVATESGHALHVLTIPGDYKAGTTHITATAGAPSA